MANDKDFGLTKIRGSGQFVGAGVGIGVEGTAVGSGVGGASVVVVVGIDVARTVVSAVVVGASVVAGDGELLIGSKVGGALEVGVGSSGDGVDVSGAAVVTICVGTPVVVIGKAVSVVEGGGLGVGGFPLGGAMVVGAAVVASVAEFVTVVSGLGVGTAVGCAVVALVETGAVVEGNGDGGCNVVAGAVEVTGGLAVEVAVVVGAAVGAAVLGTDVVVVLGAGVELGPGPGVCVGGASVEGSFVGMGVGSGVG